MTIVAIDAGRVRMMPPDGRADADVAASSVGGVERRDGRASAPRMDIRRIGAACRGSGGFRPDPGRRSGGRVDRDLDQRALATIRSRSVRRQAWATRSRI